MSEAVATTAVCACDKGSSLSVLVTAQVPGVEVCGKQIATIADFAFAAPFGTCAALDGKPCDFAPAGCWSAEVAGVLIGGLPPLVQGAKLSCVESGTVTIILSATLNVDFGNYSLPDSITTGTDDYYKLRHADFLKRHPDLPPPRYYLEYGDHYLQKMLELAPSLSLQGQEFIIRAKGLLQEALEKRRREDPVGFDQMEVKNNGKGLEDFARESHTRAYREAGIYDLKLAGDKSKILRTIGLGELLGGGREQTLEGVRDQIWDETKELPGEVAEPFGDALEGLKKLGRFR